MILSFLLIIKAKKTSKNWNKSFIKGHKLPDYNPHPSVQGFQLQKGQWLAIKLKEIP